VVAAVSIARIDPGQTGALIPVLIDALNSDNVPLQGAAADELGGSASVRNRHRLPFLGCSG
jgi:hypothetical protein